MLKRSFLATAFGLVSCSACAQTIFFDGFETETSSGLNYTAFTNWDVSSGTVDLLASGGNPGRFVDLDGSTSDSGTFRTKTAFAFEAGTVYTLTFDYRSTGGANSITTEIGSVLFTTTTSSGAYQTSTTEFSFPSATSANLVFEDLGADNVGMALDNVRIVQAVPEPGTLLATGLGLVAPLRRRRR